MEYIAKLKTERNDWRIIEYECDHKKGSKANTEVLNNLMIKKFGKILEVVEITTKQSTSDDNSEYDYFFGKGNWNKVSNKYIQFKHQIDAENIIIVSSNVKYFKKLNRYVLAIGNDKCIWLKDWQIKRCYNYWLDKNAYIVKLNKKYFIPYKLNFEFKDLLFEKDNDWEDMMQIAIIQDSSNEKWSIQKLSFSKKNI